MGLSGRDKRGPSMESSTRQKRVLGLVVCLAGLSLAQRSHGANCITNLLTIGAPFNTGNLKCTNTGFPSANGFVMWSLKDNSTQVVSIVLGAPFTGGQQWFGLGFSDQGYMVGSTAMIVKPNSTSVEVVQYALKGQVPSAVVPDTTGLAIVGVPHAYYDAPSSTAYMSFQVNFAKSTAKANHLLYAYGPLSADGSVQQHLSRTTATSTFVSGVTGPSAAEDIQKRANTHGAVAITGMGLLLPIGALIARYARAWDPAWFYTHLTVQLVGFIFLLVALGTGLELAHNIQPKGYDTHAGLGFFIFGLAILQISAVVLRPKKDAKLRKYWNWFHRWSGYLVLFLAVINIFIGFNIANAGSGVKAGYGIILAVELLALVILETLHWLRWKRHRSSRGTAMEEIPGYSFGGGV